ncbi:MAG TPA: flavin reductase family protein [Archaeoglobus profundus]|nr:flavin reductase family protein [Archaeoglobus profundus]HIP58599.1 flavin reductase family protein [Archaeoglobus profundus]
MLEYLYPLRTYLIISGTMEKPNVMTADWVVPLSFNPPMLGVAIGHRRYTKKLIDEYKEFVVAVPTIELLKDVWIAGTVSGANVDKSKKMSVTFIPSKKVKVPSIKECQANLECKVVKDVETGDHILYIGEIVDVSYGDAFKTGSPDIQNYKFILHINIGEQFTTNSSEVFKP